MAAFANYAAAKARITERQTAEDFLVLNAEDKETQMVALKDEGADFTGLADAGHQTRGICSRREHPVYFSRRR